MITLIEPVHSPSVTREPMMGDFGSIYYRNYQITGHAIERYIERIGGDAGNLISDLDSSGVFDVNRKGIPRNSCLTVIKCERDGGYALTNGKAIFMVKPGNKWHAIVTTLAMGR